jgi:hypothetical protein
LHQNFLCISRIFRAWHVLIPSHCFELLIVMTSAESDRFFLSILSCLLLTKEAQWEKTTVNFVW